MNDDDRPDPLVLTTGPQLTKRWQERCPAGKRGYPSAGQARKAHRKSGARVRTYLCHECQRWHTSNPGKGGR